MSNFTSLLPTTLALSGDNAIEAILTDIPLFCEGIMGIGVFTFLFITKQVKWTSASLYASSFMAFIAATLDLSQVIIRGTQDAANNVGLDSVAGFLEAREVFLSIAVALVDLYFWTLVAACPRGERVDVSNQASTEKMRRPLMEMHSASWDRWGVVGTILKWLSLAVLLSVPLLQIIWRLLPSQRQYGSVYVAESILQTTVTAIFILKFILNVYISPEDYWWHAFRGYTAPITALVIGACLGIGNLILFCFTETALGRFLRAVEVYILFVHSLYTAFQDVSQSAQAARSSTVPPMRDSEKGQYYGSAMPVVYPSNNFQAPRAMSPFVQTIPRQPLALNIPQRMSTTIQAFQPISDEPSYPLGQNTFEAPQNRKQELRTRPDFNLGTSFPSPLPFLDIAPRNEAIAEQRPFTAMSLSYYGTEQANANAKVPSPPASPKPPASPTSPGPYGVLTTRSPLRSPSRVSDVSFVESRNGNPQDSVTSLDEILRQQNELDKSIAALRLFSTYSDPSTSVLAEASKSPDLTTFKSTLTTPNPKSPSNRSDFSLSIFPEPPVVEAPVSSKYTEEPPRYREDGTESPVATPTLRRMMPKDIPPITVPPALESGVTDTTPSQSGLPSNFMSAGTQYDVTSFIGDLSSPSNSNQLHSASQLVVVPEDLTTDSEDTPTIATAVVLRPMILASMISGPTERPALSASTYGPEQTASPTNTEVNPMPLRPLLLGKKASISSIPSLPGGMIPLAQRRPRGNTLTNTRRPVISAPRPTEGAETTPGAFERPRPPPLRLD